MFYRVNKATCDELLGEADMSAALALPSSASSTDVSDELMRITSGSRFGMKAVGFARLLAQPATMGLVLSKELESLGKERMTLMGVQDTRRRLQQKSDEVTTAACFGRRSARLRLSTAASLCPSL